MPNCFVILKSFPKHYYFLCESIKNASNILSPQSLQHFFISLGEDNSWCLSNFILFEGVRGGLLGYEVIFDIFMISEDGNGGLKVGLKLNRLRIDLGVKHKDQQLAKVVEECSREELV